MPFFLMLSFRAFKRAPVLCEDRVGGPVLSLFWPIVSQTYKQNSILNQVSYVVSIAKIWFRLI